MTTKTNTNVKENKLEVTHSYSSARGVVVGKVFGGGLGYSTARDFTADTLDELKAKVQKAFDLGSLDKDAKFEKLLAAGVVLVDQAFVEIEGRTFTSTGEENFVVGDVDLFNEKVDEGFIFDDLSLDLN